MDCRRRMKLRITTRMKNKVTAQKSTNNRTVMRNEGNEECDGGVRKLKSTLIRFKLPNNSLRKGTENRMF